MKKSFHLLLVLVITFFTLPFAGFTASAESNDYSHIQDGTYEIQAKAINKDTGEPSAAAGFISEDATLKIANGEFELIITIPHNEMTIINGLQIEGIQPEIEEGEKETYKTFTLEYLAEELMARVQYEVPFLNMVHDVGFIFVLEGLDELPVIVEEPEEPVENPEESDGSERPGEEQDDESDQFWSELDDGDYLVDVSYLRTDNDDTSSMARYLGQQAFVTVTDGSVEVTLTVNEHQTVTKLLLDDQKSSVAKLDGDKRYETFKFNSLDPVVSAYVEYQAPFQGDIHKGKADFRIVFDDENVDKVSSKEKPGYNIERNFLNLDEGFYTIEASYLNAKDGTDSAMGRYLDQTAFISVTDNKALLTITINDHETVTSLQLDGKDAVEQVVDGNKRYETFEFEDLLSVIDAYTEYQVVQNGEIIWQSNAEFQISLDEDRIKPAKASDQPGANIEEEPEQPKEPVEVELNEPTAVKSGETIKIKDDKGTQLTMPKDLSKDATVEVVSMTDHVSNLGQLEVAGEIYEFHFENLGKFSGDFELVMSYDQDQYPLDEYVVDIYYFDEQKEQWIAQNGTVDHGTITIYPEHFSMYGVFAEKIEKSDETSDLVFEKDAEKIDYVIMHKNGKQESTADNFFVKPGLLFEKDGQTYVQLAINNGDMIKGLSSEHGDAIIVKENDDGSIVVHLEINSDLSNTLLKMRIVVPGMYDTEHEALFVVSEERDEKPKEEPKKDPQKPEPKPIPDKPEPKDLLTPDKAFKIDYVVMHENGQKESVANDFFLKPALLFEKDGKNYVHLTITNGDMVKELSNKYGDALLVKKNNDGSIVVQLRVDDLSDMLLSMEIEVPGLYAEKHHALLVFNKNSQEEIEVGDHKLIGVNIENGNGPFDRGTPQKPKFGSNDENDEINDQAEGQEKLPKENPQTGDTTNIFLYVALLIGSVIPLTFRLKRRLSFQE